MAKTTKKKVTNKTPSSVEETPKEEVQIDGDLEVTASVGATSGTYTVDSPESNEKISFRNFIETYKAQNPAKWEAKKEALLAKLNSLK